MCGAKVAAVMGQGAAAPQPAPNGSEGRGDAAIRGGVLQGSAVGLPHSGGGTFNGGRTHSSAPIRGSAPQLSALNGQRYGVMLWGSIYGAVLWGDAMGQYLWGDAIEQHYGAVSMGQLYGAELWGSAMGQHRRHCCY